MERVKLSKALKLKNRLTGEIARLRQLLSKENLKAPGAKRNYDCLDINSEMNSKIKQLIKLKTAIVKANVGVYEKILQMEEVKSLIKYYESFQCEGSTRSFNGKEYVDVELEPTIDRLTVDKELLTLRKMAEDLQDEIDEFNAMTWIEI